MSNLDLSKEVLKVDAYHINSVVIVIRRADGTCEKCLVNPRDIIKIDAIITGPTLCCDGHISSPIPTLETIEGRVINIMDNKMRIDCSKEYEHEEKVIYISNIRTIDNITNPQKPEPPKEEDTIHPEPPKEEDTTHPEGGDSDKPSGEHKPEVNNPSTGGTPPQDDKHENQDTVISSEDGTPVLIIK